METSIIKEIIAPLAVVIAAFVPHIFKRKSLNQLAEEEIEETITSNGTRTKKRRKRYK